MSMSQGKKSGEGKGPFPSAKATHTRREGGGGDDAVGTSSGEKERGRSGDGLGSPGMMMLLSCGRAPDGRGKGRKQRVVHSGQNWKARHSFGRAHTHIPSPLFSRRN